MFGSDGKFHFPENSFLLTEIFTFDPEMIFHPHFHFNSFPEKEREREREERAQIRERVREERAQIRERVREERAQIGEHRSSIAPLVGLSHRANERRDRRDRAVRSFGRSHRSSIDERRNR